MGIIGPTGAGKTTLINLLMRFYDADSGKIYLDGKLITSFDQGELRSRFGAVFQQDTIFSNTIYYNVDFNRGLAEDKIMKALQVSQAFDFVMAQPNGLETVLTARGTNLSGGQKQRLLIARALAEEPEILVLDDSSSALDYQTDALLRKAIIKEYNPTLFVISQRISSIKALDHIIVMDAGKIIAYGNHEQLLQTSKVYQEIYEQEVENRVGSN